MRKVAAITLLLLFLFNLVGYRAIFFFAQQHSEEQFVASIESSSYDEADLITITIPISNPYQLSHPEFERVDGEIEVQGKVYRYVKRKASGSEIVLLCLPDKEKTKLRSAKNEFFKNSNDIADNKGSTKSKNNKSEPFKNLSSEYDATESVPGNAFCLSAPMINGAHSAPALFKMPHLSPDQPPEA